MTPDAPLTAAWAAALYFLERALIAERAEAWWGVGLCLGLGMLSKYTIGLLGLSAFLFMLLDARARQWLRRWQPYGAALLALAVFSPGDRLECPARMGFLRVSNFAPACGTPAVRAA